MTRFKSQGFNNTFKNARKGFRLVVKSEINIRIHIVIAFLVMFFAYLLEFSALEFCMALFAIAMVIVTEMLNTAIEFTLDSIYHNRYSKMVGMAKEIFDFEHLKDKTNLKTELLNAISQDKVDIDLLYRIYQSIKK